MIFSYRTRLRIRRTLTTLVILLLLGAIALVCWFIWVGRFIIYDRTEGARLDFSLGPIPEGLPAEKPVQREPVKILYEEPDIEVDIPIEEEPEDTGIRGYYVDFEDLKSDIPAVKAKLQTLPAGTAVLLDLKNIKGHFHYSTDLGKNSTDVDIAQMDDLISWLCGSDLYAIARVPALRDWQYGLDHVPDGLPKVGANGSLWWDEAYCYWLDPTSEGTLDYLTSVALELRMIGFDEVVYTEFRFPDTNEIIFESDKTQALAEAAAHLVKKCANNRFCVSFTGMDGSFALPNGNSRLYLDNVAAAQIPDVLDQVTFSDPELHLLFLTTVNDTRFDEYCVLRPLDNAL